MKKRKILKWGKRQKERIIKSFWHMTPVEVANHFHYVGGDYGKALIRLALKKVPKKYRDEAEHYINHPEEIEKGLSRLEKKSYDCALLS